MESKSAGASLGVDPDSLPGVEKESLEVAKVKALRGYIDNPVLCYVNGMIGKRPNSFIQQIMWAFYSEGEIESAKLQLLEDAECFITHLPAAIKAKHRTEKKKVYKLW